MIPYLQLERTTAGSIASGAALAFDTVLLSSGSAISYDAATPTGIITFNTAGVYFINWFVAQQTGLSTDGSNFAIVTSPDNLPDLRGSSHVKISPASGFAIVNITAAGQTVTLVNKSAYGATLSSATQAKAGLAVFAVTDSGATPPTLELGYAQTQLAAGGALLADTDPIVFDNIITQDPYNIVTYDNATGLFTLSEIGTYLVTWEVPVSATDQNDYVDITLELNGTAYSEAHMPLPIGVLSGSAMVVVIDADSTLQLVNSSGDTVQTTDLCNIVITQINQVTPASGA